MERALLNDAIALLERVNDDLSAVSLSRAQASELLVRYARAEKLASYGRTVLARRVGDARAVAKVTGTPVTAVRRSIDTARVLEASPVLDEAMRSARVSADQAHEIARAETASPGVAAGLVEKAATSSFGSLKDETRRIRLDAQAGDSLASRQREARSVRHWVTDLGMVHLEADLEPHVGARLVNRLEHAARASDAPRRDQRLADALGTLITTDATTGSSGRTELVVLVSHEVAERGWTGVRAGEYCKVPGIGPISPQAARDLASDAFITAIITDGEDLRELKRWTRHIPIGVRIALSLGDPPGFDGLACVDCGARLGLEYDHQVPFSAGGETSLENLGLRCEPCHLAKTRLEHENGTLKPTRKPTGPRPATRIGSRPNAPP